MRYLQRRDGKWLVKGPAGGIIREFPDYPSAQYFVIYGKHPPAGMDVAKHLRGLCRKR